MSSDTTYNPKSVGQFQPFNSTNPVNIIAKRAPGVTDKALIGQVWIDTVTNSAYILTSITGGQFNWQDVTANGGGTFTNLTATGNINFNASSGAATTVVIGGVNQTGTISIGPSTAAQNINIGTGAGAAKHINIGTGNASNITTIGNTFSASGVTIFGAGGDIELVEVGAGEIIIDGSAGVALKLIGPTDVGITLQDNIQVIVGAGSPDGLIAAPAGSLWLRTDPAGATSRMYINTDSGTTWTNVTCAA